MPIENLDFFKIPEISYRVEPSMTIFSEEKVYSFKDTVLPHRGSTKYNLKIINKTDISINNYGHRSENFKELRTDKLNILFSGCSETFGEALPERHNWPNYVIKKMKDANQHFGQGSVLSFPGGSISKIVRNIFKYVDSFGKPDYIIVLLPDIYRTEVYSVGGNTQQIRMMKDPVLDTVSQDFPGISEYDCLTTYIQQYQILDIFCKTNNIKLLCSSWSKEVSKSMSNIDSVSFRSFNPELVVEYYKSKDFDQEYFASLDKDFAESAADSMHSGSISNMHAGKFFLDWINENV